MKTTSLSSTILLQGAIYTAFLSSSAHGFVPAPKPSATLPTFGFPFPPTKTSAIFPTQDTSTILKAFSLESTVAFGLWAVPVYTYIKGISGTKKTLGILDDVIEHPENAQSDEYDKNWTNLSPTALKGVEAHIKFGAPSFALYLAASLFAFPLKDMLAGDPTLLSYCNEAGALCTLLASPLLILNLLCAFWIMFEEGDFNVETALITIILIVTTLPMFQLIIWQMEYAGRMLTDNYSDFFLPNIVLWATAKTNLIIPALVGPMNWAFQWNDQALADVQNLLGAAKDADPSIATLPSIAQAEVESIATSLLTMNLYGILAVIPMWELLTSFGLWEIDSPFAKCPFSKKMLEYLDPVEAEDTPTGERNWADLGIPGMMGLYWVLSAFWLLWGFQIESIYNQAQS